MTIWTRIATALSALTKGEGLASLFDRLRRSPAPERSVGFTIAVIALGAKMAKADGEVTRNEVAAFRRIFAIPPGEEANAARVFNLARQDVAGFDSYARKIKAMFAGAEAGEQRQLLIDLMEGLFSIAVSDGNYHPGEDDFLAEVARIFGLDDRCFAALRARHVEGAPRDPYQVLGVDPAAALEDIRAAWRQAVKDSHPDRMIARGVPPEALKLAERRLIALNDAWDEISQRRAA
jgi:DnaJ like chaperone protein